MKAPATKIMPCGHKMTCCISGYDDCQHTCAHNARQAAKPVVAAPLKLATKCIQCGEVAYGFSYCGCRGWN